MQGIQAVAERLLSLSASLTAHDEQGVRTIDMPDVSEVHVPQSPAGASPSGG